jgi:zinc protease
MRKLFTALGLVLGLVVQVRAATPTQNASAASVTSAATTPSSAALLSTQPAPRKVWPQDSSDLKADPTAVFGRLDNGLRYVIFPSKTAAGRASLQLLIRTGSLMEAEDQGGMAHFLEHMAFNGTKHFPAGEMVEYFQHLGMSFGAHTNAGTTFDRTVYKLDLPRTDERIVGDGLKWFRDVLDGMTLDKKEIERERRVILAEIMANASPEYRANTDWLASLMPESIVPRRMVLGDIKSINSLAPRRFVDFHDTWYTPARTVIVAAGDFQTKSVEALIRQKFQDAKAARGEQADPPRGKVVAGQDPTATMHADRNATSVAVKMSVVRPNSGLLDSVDLRRQKTARYLAIAMFNSRLARKAADKDSTFQSAGIMSEKLFGMADANHMIGLCKAADWQATIGSLEQEIRRATTFGFTEDEYAEAKGPFLSCFQAAADQAATRQSTKVADDVIDSLMNNEVMTQPSDDLAMTKNIFSTLTKADCEQALHGFWDPQNVRIWVEGNVQLSGDGSQQILAAYRTSRATAVRPDAEQKVAKFAYTNYGLAGRIVKRTEQKDFDFVQAVFANNVHVNVKRTANEKSAVRVLVRFGGGLLEVPKNHTELKNFAESVFIGGGLEQHSLVELNRILRDKQWSLRFGVGEDAFELGGACSSAALETELQACAAYLSAPGYRPEARKQFLDSLEGEFAQNMHTPFGAIRCSGAAFLHSGDARFGFPSIEALQTVSLDDVKNWLAQPLATGYLEMTIVGDVEPQAALQLAAKTLGALPERSANKPAFAKEREVKYPAGPKTKTLSFSSADPLAISAVTWPTLGRRNVKYDRCVSVLGDVLNDRLRLKVRQELGATCTPNVICNSSDVFKDYGVVLAIMTVDAKKAAEVGSLVRKIAADLATGSISDDEFQRAIKPTLSSFAAEVRDNGYWVGVLGRSQEQPVTLENARSRETDYRAITKADLEALAKQLFAAQQATIIKVTPTPETVAAK